MPEFHDTDQLQLCGEHRWQTVREMRAAGYSDGELEVVATYGKLRSLEGRRHSTADQLHLDTAATHAAAVLDKLHSAGARVPGTSQQREADIETEERAAEALPDIYAAPIAAMRQAEATLKAASATTEQAFEEKWKEQRARELSAQRGRMTAHVVAHPSAPRLTTAELKGYAPPDPYKADLAKMRKEDR